MQKEHVWTNSRLSQNPRHQLMKLVSFIFPIEWTSSANSAFWDAQNFRNANFGSICLSHTTMSYNVTIHTIRIRNGTCYTSQGSPVMLQEVVDIQSGPVRHHGNRGTMDFFLKGEVHGKYMKIWKWCPLLVPSRIKRIEEDICDLLFFCSVALEHSQGHFASFQAREAVQKQRIWAQRPQVGWNMLEYLEQITCQM